MADMGRVNNVIRIPTSLQGRFFRIWLEFLTPLHNLTDTEKDVVASFLKNRFELSKAVSDNELLDKIVLSENIREKVKTECNISSAFFRVILGKLKKTGMIVDGKLNPKFIPKNINENDGSFKLLLYFDLNAADNK